MMLWLVASALVFSVSSAETQAPLTIRAERRFAGIYEQFTLEIRPNGVVAMSNSNFVCPDWEGTMVLGKAVGPITEHWKNVSKYLGSLSGKLDKLRGLNIRVPRFLESGSPHATRVFLNSREITSDESRKSVALGILSEACDESPSWSLEQGITVKRVASSANKGRARLEWLPTDAAAASKAWLGPKPGDCVDMTGGTRCLTPKWGVIWYRP